MIIVSQDREDIINFDNVKIINREENKISVDANFSKGDFYCIAEYATEERAKEVLQEIILFFKDEEMFHINKSTLNNLDELAEPKYILRPVSRPKVYEMPEE